MVKLPVQTGLARRQGRDRDPQRLAGARRPARARTGARYFGTSAGLYTLGVWGPQIIKSFGLPTSEVGLSERLAADRRGRRHGSSGPGIRTARTSGPGTSSLPASPPPSVSSWPASPPMLVAAVAALVLVNVGIGVRRSRRCGACRPCSCPARAAAAGLAAINSIGNLGGFAGPAMIGWIKSLTGSFAGGLYFVCGLLIVSAIVTFFVSRSVVRPSVIVKPV